MEDRMKEIRINQVPHERNKSQRMDFRLKHQIQLRLNNIGKINEQVQKNNKKWEELVREERTLWQIKERDENANQ